MFRFLTFMLTLSWASISWASPPPSRPIACTPKYCIDVRVTAPDRIVSISTNYNRQKNTSELRVDLGNGFTITYLSRPASIKHSHYPLSNLVFSPYNYRIPWSLYGSYATTSACLKCDGLPGDELMTITINQLPIYYTTQDPQVKIFGLAACYQYLDLSSGQLGNGRSLQLGPEICASSTRGEFNHQVQHSVNELQRAEIAMSFPRS